MLIVLQTTETLSRNCFLWCNTTSVMVFENSGQGIFVVGYTLPLFFYVARIMLSHRRSLYWKQPFIYTVLPTFPLKGMSSNLSSRFSTFYFLWSSSTGSLKYKASSLKAFISKLHHVGLQKWLTAGTGCQTFMLIFMCLLKTAPSSLPAQCCPAMTGRALISVAKGIQVDSIIVQKSLTA